MARQRKPPKYRSPCECGRCPKLPADRPPTLDEWVAYWSHDGWFSPEKVEELAVGLYVHRYAVWVNCHGWRKPPGWTGGKLPRRSVLPKKRRILPAEVKRIEQRLLAERRRARARPELEQAS